VNLGWKISGEESMGVILFGVARNAINRARNLNEISKMPEIQAHALQSV
jgi:hypothetical protein